MAYEKFIPSVWAEDIDRELERLCVFVEDCNTKYEGKVKKQGESVTILGVGRPTIKTLARKNASDDIDGPETIEDGSIVMYIHQIAYFNYMVGDIDQAQAVNGVMEALSSETSEVLANEVDRYIASKAVDSDVPKLYNAPVKVVSGQAADGEKNVLDILDEAIQKLQENDVSDNTPIVVTISPRFYTLLKKAYRELDTDNSGIIKHGKVGMYGNVTVKRSNNVHKTDKGEVDNIMIRTKRAVAFAKPLTHTEAYRPEKKFADAVKGYILYDAKVVRPKEIFNINVKYA
jgi:hypothetical protein